MSGINTELYEAAELDGANRFQRCLHVTIPAILPTISTLLVLNIGSLCGSAAFEKVFLLYTPTTYETADIIATYVYRMGLGSGNYSYATAVRPVPRCHQPGPAHGCQQGLLLADRQRFVVIRRIK